MNEQMGCPDHWVLLCWPRHRLIPVKGEQAMRKRWKQAAAVVTAAVLTASVLPVDRTVWAASAAGTPYTAAGAYDVTVPHVIVNQVYGGSDDGNASHSFIELYNQSDSTVDLKGWQLAYRSSQDGEHCIAMSEVVKSQFWQAHFDKEPFQVPVNQIVVQMLSELIGKYQIIWI